MIVSSTDELLVDMGLYPLGSYLDYWVRTYDRCLRVGTNQITERAEEIGQFIGLDSSRVTRKSSHGNQTAEKHGILQKLASAHVEEKLTEICQPLIREFDHTTFWT